MEMQKSPEGKGRELPAEVLEYWQNLSLPHQTDDWFRVQTLKDLMKSDEHSNK